MVDCIDHQYLSFVLFEFLVSLVFEWKESSFEADINLVYVVKKT